MAIPQYLKPWLSSRQLALPFLLFIILLSAITQFATFALSQNFVISDLGVQPEDITLAFQMSYIGILFIFPIQFRLIRYFELRNYLLGVICFGILLSFACMHVEDFILFCILRFLQGVVVCMIAASMLTLFNIFLKPAHKHILAPSIFYGTILSSAVLIGIIFANLSVNDDWKEIYRYLIGFQSTSLIIVLSSFKSRSGFKPYPLYQIDWKAAIFFLTAAVASAYTLIYGSKYYWYSDYSLQMGGIIAIVFTGLFLHRNLIAKRPLINLGVFRSQKFWFGMILLALYYGIKDSLNLVFGYTTSLLQWSAPKMMSLGFYNIFGVLIFMLVSGKLLLQKKITIPVLIFIGFAVLLIYQLWIYNILTPDLSYGNLIVPVFLQGAASGLLFVPIMLFTLSAISPADTTTGLIIAAYVRFFALLNVSAGFYNLQIHYNKVFKDSLLAHISSLDDSATERFGQYREFYMSKGFNTTQADNLAYSAINRVLSQQTQLLTYRAVFMELSYIVIGIVVTLILIWFGNLLMSKFTNAKQQQA